MANNQHVNKVTFGDAVLVDLTEDTISADKMLNGVVAHDKSGATITGTIESLNGQTITPGTTDQTINSGKYLSGNQIVKGDTNLLAGNIKKDTTIFGVTGTLSAQDLAPTYDGSYQIT